LDELNVREKEKEKKNNTNFDVRGTRNGDDVVALTKNPRKTNLPSSGITFRANLFQAVGEFEDIREVFLREPSKVDELATKINKK
jgi:hypothetical protein